MVERVLLFLLRDVRRDPKIACELNELLLGEESFALFVSRVEGDEQVLDVVLQPFGEHTLHLLQPKFNDNKAK